MPVPEEAEDASAVLVMVRFGHFTSMTCAPELGEPAAVLVSDAVLLYEAQLVEEVGAVTCAVSVAPAATVTGWPTRVSVWLPAAPPMTKVLAGLCVAIDQVTGVPTLPPGRASVRLIPVAAPLPVFWIVTV